MASITTRKNGSRFITFHNARGEPQYITLGKVPKRYAEAVKVRVEDLASAKLHGHAPADDTLRWLRDLDDHVYGKLAAVGLVAPRQALTLGAWVMQYLDERKGELKAESHRKLGQTLDKLVGRPKTADRDAVKGYFDPDVPLRQLTPQDAAEWRQWLRSQGLSEAAIKTHIGNAKTIMREAVRRKLIEDDPFQHLKSGPTPSRYTRYVTPDEIARIIDACPNAEWKLLFGLARYAGLRIPSESHLLTWADVDWERGRLTVRSPKTERYAGHEQRLVPVTPNLMKLLLDRFTECGEDDQHLVTIRGQGRIMRTVRAVCARAGVELWARLWQTLRQSCEKEWAMTFPQYAVSKWIGHSITVSGRHYANDVPDELFRRAAGVPAVDPNSDPNSAQRNAQRNRALLGGNERKRKTTAAQGDDRNSLGFKDFPEFSVSPCSTGIWRRGESNPRPEAFQPGPLRV